MEARELPHMVRMGRYQNRLMTWDEFQQREQLANLRKALPFAGPLRKMGATGVAAHVGNHLRVRYGLDEQGMVPAAKLDGAIALLLDLHTQAVQLPDNIKSPALYAFLRQVVGGGYAFPSTRRARGAQRSLH